MNLLLMEYLSSGDKEEAARCLKELEVPHFHHELVYEAVVMVIEKGDQRCAQMMSSLLQHMANITIITPDQFDKVRNYFITWIPTLYHPFISGFHASVSRPHRHCSGCS